MPPPLFHILISAKGSPGCCWFHAPSIPLQPKHKNLFSWRSSWTEELLHLKSLLNGFIRFPLFTLKALPALSIPHKCPVSLCKQHLVLKKITNATHYHHPYKNCSCFAFMNREHGRALSCTAQPCTQAWPGWWKLSVWNEPVQHQYNSQRGFKHSRCQKNHSVWEAHGSWLSFLEAHCPTCSGVPHLMLLHWNKKSKWKDQYQIQE